MALPTPEIPILKVAWKRYAELDAASYAKSRRHRSLRRWVAVMGVLATLFALLANSYPADWPVLPGLIIKIFFVATPISVSILAAFIGWKFSKGDWLALRAGAEGILREIYTYRTILHDNSNRRAWLEQRVVEIQRQMFRNLGGELVLKPYKGKLPPYHQEGDPDSDAGIQDLSGDEYFRFRLQSQLAWHIKKNNQYESERNRIKVATLIAGGLGSFIAAFATFGYPNLTTWVALTAVIVSALTGWEELRNLDAAIKNYSKVILELSILHDHWENLEPEERTVAETYEMVHATEEILWSQNIEYIKSMQEALASVRDEEAELINQVIRDAKAADARLKADIRQQVVAQTQESFDTGTQVVQDTFRSVQENFLSEVTSERAREELGYILSASGAVVSALNEKLKNVAAEFSGIEFTKETPKETLHAKMNQYPATGELKG